MTAEPLRQPALHGLVATVVTLTLLASCGSPDDDSRAAPSPTQHTASPLAPYMSLLALDSAEQLRLDLEGERLIASCLKEQGFDYDQPYVADDVVLDSSIDPAEWAATFGYGVTTLSQDASTGQTQSRSGAEQAAYDLALFGTGTDPDSGVAYDWEQEGCLGSAYHEASDGMDDVMRDEKFAAFFTAHAAVQEGVAASEPAADLAREWSDCMADAGHAGIASPADAKLTIQQDLAAALSVASDQTLPSSEIADLRSAEITLASTDLACQDAVDYAARYDQVLRAAEASLLEDFRTDLEALAVATGR